MSLVGLNLHCMFAKIAKACDVHMSYLLLGIGTNKDTISSDMPIKETKRYFAEDRNLSKIGEKLSKMLFQECFPFDIEFWVVVVKRIYTHLQPAQDKSGFIPLDIMDREIERERRRIKNHYHHARIEMMTERAPENSLT